MPSFDFTRRDALRLLTGGAVALTSTTWLGRLAAETARNPQRKRSCILLWMSGGPSTIDLFDLKPGHANGGPFTEIDTAAPGLRFGQHLPKLAKQAKHLA